MRLRNPRTRFRSLPLSNCKIQICLVPFVRMVRCMDRVDVDVDVDVDVEKDRNYDVDDPP
ncbi:hypothetical protein HanIR_Chr09g0413201 [Helianthus annuus]|nr:hypothetical protein HanIR_Chr09g0413201 [Helianthus annuus]